VVGILGDGDHPLRKSCEEKDCGVRFPEILVFPPGNYVGFVVEESSEAVSDTS